MLQAVTPVTKIIKKYGKYAENISEFEIGHKHNQRQHTNHIWTIHFSKHVTQGTVPGLQAWFGWGSLPKPSPCKMPGIQVKSRYCAWTAPGLLVECVA